MADLLSFHQNAPSSHSTKAFDDPHRMVLPVQFLPQSKHASPSLASHWSFDVHGTQRPLGPKTPSSQSTKSKSIPQRAVSLKQSSTQERQVRLSLAQPELQ